MGSLFVKLSFFYGIAVEKQPVFSDHFSFRLDISAVRNYSMSFFNEQNVKSPATILKFLGATLPEPVSVRPVQIKTGRVKR
jgi:hypothetical protein